MNNTESISIAVRCDPVALAILPLLLVVGVNRWPQPFVGAYDRLASVGTADGPGEAGADARPPQGEPTTAEGARAP